MPPTGGRRLLSNGWKAACGRAAISAHRRRPRNQGEFRAQLKHEHDFAQAGPTFDRLKRAHPRATDDELKQAIIAAVKFDDDCFKYFRHGRAEDYWDMCILAVERAATDNPPYLEATYRDARNYVAYCMK